MARTKQSKNHGKSISTTHGVELTQDVEEQNNVEEENEIYEGGVHSDLAQQLAEESDVSEPDDLPFEDDLQIQDSTGVIRVKRGPIRMKEIWTLPVGHKIVTNWNEHNQPVYKGGGVLSFWLGTIARNATLCPIDYLDWRLLKADKANEILELVKERFLIPNNDAIDRWILSSIDHKWREYKNFLKAKKVPADVLNMTNNLPPEIIERIKNEIKRDVPKNVSTDQWKALVEYWFTKKGMKRAKIGKDARKAALDSGIAQHTTGSMSYARKYKKVAKKLRREPGKIEFFEVTHIKKKRDLDGAFVFVNDTSRNKVQEARDLLNERVLEASSSDNINSMEAEVFAEIFGADKPGQARGYGLGVRPSHLTDNQVFARNNVCVDELGRLREQLQIMKQQQEVTEQHHQERMRQIEQRHNEQMDNMQSMMNYLSVQLTTMLSHVTGGPPLGNGMWGSMATVLGNQGNGTRSSQQEDGLRSLMQFMGIPFTPPLANTQVPNLSNRSSADLPFSRSPANH